MAVVLSQEKVVQPHPDLRGLLMELAEWKLCLVVRVVDLVHLGMRQQEVVPWRSLPPGKSLFNPESGFR